MRVPLVLALAIVVAPGRSEGQGQDPSPRPVALPGEDPPSKLTASAYEAGGRWTYDLNLRRKFGPLVGWVGAFVDPLGQDQGRLGAEFDCERRGLLLVPSLQAGTNGLLAGQIYSEVGGRVYAIAAVSRTNLRAFYNLSWDPNESVQLGAGLRLGESDRLAGFTIADIRLHTAQQGTHLVFRHHLRGGDRVTLDAVYKSGRGDDGRHLRGVGLGIAFDRGRAFARAAYDPHVNFTSDDMVRLAAGWRF